MSDPKKNVVFIRKNGRIIPIRVGDKRLAQAKKRVGEGQSKGAKVGAAIGGAVGAAAIGSEAKGLGGELKRAGKILKGPKLKLAGHKVSAVASFKNRVRLAGKAISKGNKSVLAASAIAGGAGALWGGMVGSVVGGVSAANKEAKKLLAENSKKKKKTGV